jgi:hypothetical protein
MGLLVIALAHLHARKLARGFDSRPMASFSDGCSGLGSAVPEAKAAAAEAAVTAAEITAVVDLQEANRLAADFVSLGGGALTMALA